MKLWERRKKAMQSYHPVSWGHWTITRPLFIEMIFIVSLLVSHTNTHTHSLPLSFKQTYASLSRPFSSSLLPPLHHTQRQEICMSRGSRPYRKQRKSFVLDCFISHMWSHERAHTHTQMYKMRQLQRQWKRWGLIRGGVNYGTMTHSIDDSAPAVLTWQEARGVKRLLHMLKLYNVQLVWLD